MQRAPGLGGRPRCRPRRSECRRQMRSTTTRQGRTSKYAQTSEWACASHHASAKFQRAAAVFALKSCARRCPPPAKSFLPADFLLELLELVFLHEDRVLLAGINAVPDLIAVIGESLLDDRHEIAIDFGVARRVFFIKAEQVRADNMYAVRGIARTETYHRYRQRLRQV